MSSSTSNSSLARSRSLKLPPPNTLKLLSTTPHSASGPSYITLFLTNLRLLDLDLRDDWPGITVLTFSTKDAQQNQKKRIQCVEWALYQLFALWDPEETRNKLQPFFPPLEPLQSLNLRAALFRYLEQAKKNGVLGRDTVLRKTMLDECKGERLEEVLAVFSNAVLKQVLQDENPEDDQAIAHQLAVESLSYKGDKSILSSLVWIHKSSLGRHLRSKEDARRRYKDFSDLLNLHERRIVRRHEQLKQVVQESRGRDLPTEKEVAGLQKTVQNSWAGNEEWMGSVLQGDSTGDRFLESRFDKIWRHVENGTISDVEGSRQVGLLEQLDHRVKDQQNRLAWWQEFGRSLNKASTSSPTTAKFSSSTELKVINLEFNEHQTLRIGPIAPAVNKPNPAYLHEYTELIENMMSDLEAVEKPKGVPELPSETLHQPRPAPLSQINQESIIRDEEWPSASDKEEPSPAFDGLSESRLASSQLETPATTYSNRSTQDLQLVAEKGAMPPPRIPSKNEGPITRPKAPMIRKARSPSPPPSMPRPQSQPKPPSFCDSEANALADQILSSVSAASPSPKKPRHSLSLAERTRLSISRASHSKYSDLHDDLDNFADLPNLSKRNSMSPTKPDRSVVEQEQAGKHAGLVERTRRSMAGFEAAQKKAQVERRKSVKEAKRRETESRKSYFPKVEEETPDVSAIELIEKEGSPDYESVFKSRPKIKTSPTVSPTRIIWEDKVEG